MANDAATPSGPSAKSFQEPGWFTRNVFNRAVNGLMALGISIMGSRVLAVRAPADPLLYFLFTTPGLAMPTIALINTWQYTGYTALLFYAGMLQIPQQIYESAAIDGAGEVRMFFRITLPLLRPAFLVALVINLMNVFNSFPIIWEMTRGGPGYETSTTTVFMYDLKGTFVGQAAAMSIVNFTLVVVIVLVFLRLNRWNRQEAA